MAAKALKPRRLGCLARLFILVLLMFACYWLLLAPLPERYETTTEGTAIPQPEGQVVVEGEINSTQQVALQELSSASKGLTKVLAQNGQIQYLAMNVKVSDTAAASLEEKASYFLQNNSSLFQIQNPVTALKIKGRTTGEAGNTFIRYEQEYKGIPVYGSQAIVEVSKTGEIESVSAGYSPSLEVDIQPAIRSTQAEAIALQDLGDPNGQFLVPTRLVIYDAKLFGETTPDQPRLAWDVMVASSVELSIRSYLVDAQTGQILLTLDEVVGIRDRRVWDAQGKNINPSNLVDAFNSFSKIFNSSQQVMNEQGPISGMTADEDAQRAWRHAGMVYDYYYGNFKRDSIDGAGEPINLYVNAGNCDGSLWQPFWSRPIFCNNVTSLDSVSHELTHGVWFSWGTRAFYKGEAAALTESFSDIFAAFIDDIDPWRITGDDSAPDAPGKILFRNLADPASTGGFTQYSQYIQKADGRQVYQNSTIHSYAVYLLSEGTPEDKKVNGVEIQGIGRKKSQYIYYDVMANRMILRVTFKGTREAAITACQKLVGSHDINSEDCDQVMNAYAAVGIGEPAEKTAPPVSIPVGFGIEWQDLWGSWRENIRKAVDDLLGNLGLSNAWKGLQDFIAEIRSNSWVKLLECVRKRDQACIDQSLMDMVNSIGEAIVASLNNFCLNLLFIPAALFYFVKRKPFIP